jgi:hypothetical protein
MKTKISEWSTTPASNTDIDGINIAEGCAPSGINDAIRDMMAQIRSWQSGATGDPFAGPLTGSLNGTVGATTPNTGAFTTISASGAITSTLATGSAPLVIASTTKVSNLNVDLLDGADWASPAALGSTTPAAVSATTLTTSSTVTVNGGTANGVTYLNGSKVLTSGSALTFDGNILTNTTGAIRASGSTVPSTGAGLELLYGASGTGISTLLSYDRGAGAYKPMWLDGSYQAYFVSGSEQMRLTSTGLGIGTSSPNYLTTLYKATLPVLQLANSTSGSTSSDGLLIYLNGSNAMISNQETGYLAFETAGTTRATIDSSGNLGLGVTPSAWSSGQKVLEFSGGSFYGFGSGAGTVMSTNTYYNGTNNIYKNTATASQYIQSSGQHAWYTAASGTAGNPISFTQAMTLDASGNLGVGTTSPGCRIDVISPNNTSLNPTIRVNSNNVAVNTAISYDGIQGNGDLYVSTTSAAAPIMFRTNSTERARIDSSGNLLLGTTSTLGGAKQTVYSSNLSIYTGISIQNGTAYPSGAGAYISFYNSAGSVAGYINQTGTTTVAYTTSSDYRLKENITPMTGALAKVAQLKPVTYKWKSDGLDSEGFIAHELAEICPQAVVGEKDAVDAEGNPKYQGIDTSFLVATLTAALQELNAKFDAYVATHP